MGYPPFFDQGFRSGYADRTQGVKRDYFGAWIKRSFKGLPFKKVVQGLYKIPESEKGLQAFYL
jgi:hypothetical protein